MILELQRTLRVNSLKSFEKFLINPPLTMANRKQQGYGCMGLSAFYTSAKKTTPDQAKAIVHHAFNAGVRLFNSATFYGELNEVGFGANLRLLRHAFEGLDRSQYQIMVKIGMDTRCPVEKTGTSWVLHSDAAGLKADVDYGLSQLGTDYIDIIVLCRVPHDRPIEESVAAMAEIVKDGKARHIGLSEASAETIRRAHAVHPISYIEQEWSLWARDIEEEIVPTCRELGVKIVAYSPLGRGFLTGSIRDRNDGSLDPHDYRLISPKFAEGNLQENLKLVDAVQAIANRRGITVGQLALAWLHAQGDDVIPIPGTSNPKHFDQNYAALNIALSTEELNEINEIFRPDAAKGERYPGNHWTFHHDKH